MFRNLHNRKKIIFFDLDGPIIDVSERYYKVYSDFCILNKIVPYPIKRYWNLKTNKKKINIPQNKLSDFKKFWIKYIESNKYLKFNKIQPEARETLDSLSEKYEMHLVTLRKSKKNILKELNNFGINKYFKKIFVSSPAFFDSAKNWQIKKKLIQNIARKNDIIFGDTNTDIKCGKSLKLKNVAVANGVCSKNILRGYNPDHIIPKFNLRYLKKIT